MKNNIEWEKVLSSQIVFEKCLNDMGAPKPKWYWKYTNFFEFTIPDFFFECKMKYQVLTRGYSDRNVWNMNYDLAELNIKLLTKLRDTSSGYPPQLTEKKWKAILTKMIEGFQAFDDSYYLEDKKSEKKYKEGMKLYAEYFSNLWD